MDCHLKLKKRDKERSQKKALSKKYHGSEGCYFCGERCVDGKKVCQKHLEICRKNIERATNSKNHKLICERQKAEFSQYFFQKHKKR